MVRIAIVDDHPIVAGAMADLLTSSDRYIVHCVCHSVEQFIQAHEHVTSDLLLIDIALAEKNSLTQVPTLIATYPTLKIIVFSMFDSLPYVRAARKSGARGFVSKSRLHTDLLLAVECVLTGAEFFEPEIIEMTSHLSGAQLSPRERYVLRLAVLGYAPKNIAVELNCAVKTVHAHLANIAGKLQSKDRLVWRQVAQAESLIGPVELT